MGNAADRMAHIKPPRAMLVKFARGSMFGEPGNVKRQRRIILDALAALQTMTEPGTIQELPYRWKQPDPEWLQSSNDQSARPAVSLSRL